MFVNTTKTTLPVLKIAIAWNDEEGFLAINKIIQLCRWMRVNFIFEPIELAGKNYQKNMIYGIDEENLTRLKSADVFLHTRLDYSFFEQHKHVNVEDYIDIAEENLKRVYFVGNDIRIRETVFFSKNKQYIANIEDIEDFKVENQTDKVDGEFSTEFCDFYTSIGHKYAVFCLNDLNEKKTLKCFIELLNFVGLTEKVGLIKQFIDDEKAVEKAIKFLQSSKIEHVSFVEKEKIDFLPALKFVNLVPKKIVKITDKKTNCEGKFLVSELVSSVKKGEIKIADDLYLYQIFANGVEVYPNVNFWNTTVINPVILCKHNSEKEIQEVSFKDF